MPRRLKVHEDMQETLTNEMEEMVSRFKAGQLTIQVR